MARNTIRADEWLLGRFKKRFSKRQWASLFGGHPIPLGGAPIAPPFSPSDITGLKMWLDFSDLDTLFQETDLTSPITTDGQTIKGIVDKSGTVGGYTNVAGGATYKENIQNGLSVGRMAFQAVYANVGVNHGIGTGDFYYIGALKNSGPDSNIAGIWDSNSPSNSPAMWVAQNTQRLGCYLNGYQTFTGSLSITSPQILEFWRESGVIKAAIDGVQDATTFAYADAITNNTQWAIGRSSTGTYLFTGDRYEDLLYAGLPTSGQRTALREYLDAKWAVF